MVPASKQADPAWLDAMWTRLITIANECWVATYRASYSTIVSEALDIGCEILDSRGGSLAHGTRSIPVFNMIMPGVTRGCAGEIRDDYYARRCLHHQRPMDLRRAPPGHSDCDTSIQQ